MNSTALCLHSYVRNFGKWYCARGSVSVDGENLVYEDPDGGYHAVNTTDLDDNDISDYMCESFEYTYEKSTTVTMRGVVAAAILGVYEGGSLTIGNEQLTCISDPEDVAVWLDSSYGYKLCVMPKTGNVFVSKMFLDDVLAWEKEQKIKRMFPIGAACGPLCDGMRFGQNGILQFCDAYSVGVPSEGLGNIQRNLDGLCYLAILIPAALEVIMSELSLIGFPGVGMLVTELVKNIGTLNEFTSDPKNTSVLRNNTAYFLIRNGDVIKGAYVDCDNPLVVLRNLDEAGLRSLFTASSLKIEKMDAHSVKIEDYVDRHLHDAKPASISREIRRIVELYDKEMSRKLHVIFTRFVEDCCSEFEEDMKDE